MLRLGSRTFRSLLDGSRRSSALSNSSSRPTSPKTLPLVLPLILVYVIVIKLNGVIVVWMFVVVLGVGLVSMVLEPVSFSPHSMAVLAHLLHLHSYLKTNVVPHGLRSWQSYPTFHQRTRPSGLRIPQCLSQGSRLSSIVFPRSPNLRIFLSDPKDY